MDAVLVTPNPEDYGLIMSLARRLARKEVEAQLRGQGVRLTLVPPREINAKAREYLAQHLELYREAVRIVAQHPEWRPKRKHRRSVSLSDHANAGTEIAQEKGATSAIFSAPHILFDDYSEDR